MFAFLIVLLLTIRSRFTRRTRLEAENLVLRQQLGILRRKAPTRVRLWNIDRLQMVWLYRLYPSLLDAIIVGGENPLWGAPRIHGHDQRHHQSNCRVDRWARD
jgi:hypothetical protein